MTTKQALEHERPESVRILDGLKFEWHQEVGWTGYKLVTTHGGSVISFPYKELADHDTAWLKGRLIAQGFSDSDIERTLAEGRQL